MSQEETTDAVHAAYRVVPVREDTRAEFVATDLITWFDEVDERDPEPGGGLDWERSHAATATGEPPFAGVYSSYPMAATVPGPGSTLQQVPLAGLSWVGVHPDHRRRGVLTAMLDHHFADLRGRGEALAGLHASETGIYGRFGYAVAAGDAVVELGPGAQPDAPGVDAHGITTELLTLGRTASASACTPCTSPSRPRPSDRSRARRGTPTTHTATGSPTCAGRSRAGCCWPRGTGATSATPSCGGGTSGSRVARREC